MDTNYILNKESIQIYNNVFNKQCIDKSQKQ